MKLQFIAPLFDCISVIGIGICLLLSRKRAVAKISDTGKKAKVERSLKYCGILAIVGGALTGIPNILKVLPSGNDAVQFARHLKEASPRQIDSITRFAA
jgi:hypothetical protein